MIEDSLVESARVIKKNFDLLNHKLLSYDSDVSNLSSLMIKVSSEIKDIGKRVSKKDTVQDIQKMVFEKLTDLEVESDKLSDKINLVNSQMEKLKKEEVDLFEIIKKRNPSMSDDDIKIEIQRRIL